MHKASSQRPKNRQPGFTLVELLAVITIIIILLTLIVPGLVSVLRSTGLNSAINVVVDQIVLARQTAMSRNERVEVRFYQLPDPNGLIPTGSGTSTPWRGVRAWAIPESGVLSQAIPLSKVYMISAPTIISCSSTLTTLLNNQPPAIQVETFPQYTTPVPYSKFRFYPNGQAADFDNANAAGIPVYMTLYVDQIHSDNSNTTQLPTSYAVLQLDDFTGSVRIFRP